MKSIAHIKYWIINDPANDTSVMVWYIQDFENLGRKCKFHNFLFSRKTIGDWTSRRCMTPPGHLVSPLVYRGPWMSTVVLYCWCNRDSASVLLYFTSTPYTLLNSKVFCNFGSGYCLNWRYYSSVKLAAFIKISHFQKSMLNLCT